ncbi:MAG: ABC transporter ATP-binding protein [Oscillospiraceae bacterium]|nr:ABC transporter ATP-binding protein [Oscillospiraceae bacterium]
MERGWDSLRELLKVENLCKTFKLSQKQQKSQQTHEKTIKAVNNLSFSAYAGEVFGLLGPNGAGKTTTLRILSTLIKPDSGSAILDGFDVTTQPYEVRRRIGFLTSELKLEEFFTPDYLFGFFSSLYGLPPDRVRRRKEELFTRFGVSAFAHVKVANLSTGMKQKVSLLISLVHDPDVIIFDEPTNGLDVLTARVVTDFLLELKGLGKTLIVSTHIFSLAEKICDRVGIIMDGKMRACDALQNLTANDSLEDTFFALHEQVSREGGLAQ